MKALRLCAVAAVIAIFGLAACDTGTENPVAGDSVTGIMLNPPSLTLSIGGTAALTAVVLPVNAANKAVNWSSVNPGVAAVSENGSVIGVAVGQATIIAISADGGKFATCDVTVSIETAPVSGITLDKMSLSLLVGDIKALTATVIPADATNKNVNWTSSKPGVAAVNQSGTITALSPGLTVITAKTVDGGKEAICAVSVIEETAAGAIAVTGVSLNPPTLTLEAGRRGSLIATIQPANASNKAVNWASSNPAIAEVDANGNVSAKGHGTAMLYVSTLEGGHSASAVVTVSGGPPTGVSLVPSTLTLETGEIRTLTATVVPADAANKNVTWSSDNPAVVVVDTNGNVSAKDPGTTTIYATTVEGGHSASSVVTVSGSRSSPTGVSLSPLTLTLKPEETKALTATVMPADAVNKSITWTSNNPTVAAVDANGNVTAKGFGTAVITVTTVEGSFTASCEVTVRGTFTVTFNANEGSGTPPVPATVSEGASIPIPNKGGLYRTGSLFNFSGWNTQADGKGKTYQPGERFTPEADTYLYAIWTVPATLAEKLTSLRSNAQSNGSYILEVDTDETITPQDLSYPGRNITITLKGMNREQTIRLSSNGTMFTIRPGVTLILDRYITLQGHSGNTRSLVRVDGGTLEMNSGSTITGNTARGSDGGGGVYVNYGTFTMNGGYISNNTVSGGRSMGGGVYVNGGTFTMSGGDISNNTASGSGSVSGGGVHVDSGTFTMNGGTISKNTISSSSSISSGGGAKGGGVYVNGGTFTKTGGTIYGYSATDTYSNVAKTSPWIQSNNGHAVYATGKYRDTTAGPDVNMDSRVAGAAGGWDN